MTDEIATWVQGSLGNHSLRDHVTYDVTITVDPQHGPLVLVLLWMQSLVIGEFMQVVGAMPNPANVTSAQVDSFVKEGLEAMRQQRSQQAAQGPQPGLGGLLVPGR